MMSARERKRERMRMTEGTVKRTPMERKSNERGREEGWFIKSNNGCTSSYSPVNNSHHHING